LAFFTAGFFDFSDLPTLKLIFFLAADFPDLAVVFFAAGLLAARLAILRLPRLADFDDLDDDLADGLVAIPTSVNDQVRALCALLALRVTA